MSQVQNPFTQEDNEFLDGLNSGPVESRIYVTALHGYMRNLDRGDLQHLENIYKRIIRQEFVLCFHCSADVLNMVLDIYNEREKYQAQEVALSQAQAGNSEPEELTNLLTALAEAQTQFGDESPEAQEAARKVAEYRDGAKEPVTNDPKTGAKTKTTRKK